MRSRRLRTVLLAVALAIGGADARQAEAQALEKAVKATFLTKFAPYVSWPPAAIPAAGTPYMICIVGHDPFGALLDEAAAGERLGASPMVVRRLVRIDRSSACHMAFVGGSSEQSVAAGLAVIDGAPVLTVTDASITRERGMVHFELKAGRVRFHVDEVAAARAGIGLSSKLMKLALSVRRGRG